MAQTPGQQPGDNPLAKVWKWVVGTTPGRVAGFALLVAVAVAGY